MKTKNSEDIINAEEYSAEELRDVVFGNSDRLPKVLALALLGRKTYPNKLTDLQRVLQDENESPKVRHVATVELARIGTEEASRILQENIEVKNELVLRGVLDGLTKIGRPEALRAAAARQEQVEMARSAVQLTTSMNAFKADVESFRIPFPQPTQFLDVDPNRTAPITLEPATAELVTQSVVSLAKTAPDLTLSDNTGVIVQCRGRNFLLLFDQTFLDQNSVQPLLTQKMTPGVIAVRHPLDADTWEARFYVLTQPAEANNQFQVLLMSSNGTLVYAGTADVDGERVEFTLKTVEHPGATPLEIKGVYEAGVLRFEQAHSELRSRKKLVPNRRRR